MAKGTLSRSLHDVGLAAWFGGTLANAVALNPASAQADTATGTGRVANTGWNKWTPVNAAAIGAHLAGSVGEIIGNRSRLAAQRGVASTALAKTGLTVAALAVTGYSRLLGRKVDKETSVPAGGHRVGRQHAGRCGQGAEAIVRVAVGRPGTHRCVDRRQLADGRAAAGKRGQEGPAGAVHRLILIHRLFLATAVAPDLGETAPETLPIGSLTGEGAWGFAFNCRGQTNGAAIWTPSV